MKPIFIAEIKTRSPYGFKSPYTFVSLMNYAITYGEWISVHTNALWGGDFDTISFVKRNTKKPILAKGIHGTTDSILKAFDHGADYVLVVDRVAGSAEDKREDWFKLEPYKDRILFELDYTRVKRLVEFSSTWMERKYVYNSRDLRSGLPKKLNELDDFLGLGVWTCQASGIRTIEDVNPKSNAFIVGEHLVNFCKSLPRD